VDENETIASCMSQPLNTPDTPDAFIPLGLELLSLLVERELGERGKVKGESRSLSEGVPPSMHPVSTPAPAPVPEPAPAPAPTPALTNGDSFSPSTHVQLSPEPIVEDLSLVQVLLAQQASLIVDQQKLMHEREE
jgi:hypothetical protein